MMKFLAAFTVIVAVGIIAAAQNQPAELILKNGTIYTVNDKQPHAEAIAIRTGRFVFVGANRGVSAYVGKTTRVIDLRGKTVLPGLTDSHYHLAGVGARELNFNLEGVNSLPEFLTKVKERVERAQPDEWIVGRGWIETFWKPQVFPTRWDLDRAAPNNPVYLTRADGHGGVANSAALKKAGVDRDTPSPFGGEIMNDAKTGEPNGMLLDAAQSLVRRHIVTKPNDPEQELRVAAKRSVELGWCQIQNAGSSYDEVTLLRKLYRERQLKLRVYNAVYGPGPASARLLRDGPILGEFDHRLTVRDIKVVFDGALGSKGAALLEPYADHNTSGFLTRREEELMPMFIDALKRGIQIETHAIGDRANRIILDLYEKAFVTVPPDQRKVRDPRWRVEHAQVVTAVDIPRFAKLGVIPSMQPSHAIGDLHFAPSRLGMERLAGAYAWQSFLKTGSIIAGGSDAPVERGEPMIEFYAAVTRKDQHGFSGEGWHPEQAVSREQALKMFTIWPAYAAFEEDLRGTIQVGKLADLTVLSNDIMKITPPQILKTRCVMTVIGGEVVAHDGSVGHEAK